MTFEHVLKQAFQVTSTVLHERRHSCISAVRLCSSRTQLGWKPVKSQVQRITIESHALFDFFFGN